MFKKLIIILFLLLLSCSTLLDNFIKINELPVEQRKNVFLLKDFQEIIDSSYFQLIPNKKGVKLPYLKNVTKLHGISILFRPHYKHKKLDQTLILTTSIGYLTNRDKALRLFSSQKKIGLFYKNSIKELKPNGYNVDKIYCIENKNLLFILVQKERFVYYLSLENVGLIIKEGEIRAIFKTKMVNAFKSYKNSIQ